MAGLIEQALPAQEHPPGRHTMPDGTVMDGDQIVAPAEGEAPEADESDPAFQAALRFAMAALYKNDAADGVARALLADPSAQNLGDTAYRMVEVVDERTDGTVPEDLLAVLAMQILKEIVDIADAAGVEFKPSDIATAFRDMVLRFVEDAGYDAAELRNAMGQIDPMQFDALSAEDEAVPAPAQEMMQ